DLIVTGVQTCALPISVPVRWNIRALGAFEFAVQGAAPLSERVVRRLRFAFVFIKTGATLPSKHLSVAQPEKDGRNVIAAAVSFRSEERRVGKEGRCQR